MSDLSLACKNCGQVDRRQTGEYPCPVCSLPHVHDVRPELWRDADLDPKIRQKVHTAFDLIDYRFFHQWPHRDRDFIDGMAWVGVLCGAALLVGDLKIATQAEGYLLRLLKVGNDARNYAPSKVNDKWVPSKTMAGHYYYKKPQSFAGPAGLEFAIQCGAQLISPFKPVSTAKWFVRFGGLYGMLYKHAEWLQQHASSVWLAHLILQAKPASRLFWMVKENPLFSYIAGVPCDVEYPAATRFVQGENQREKNIVPFNETKPSIWPFRRNPYDRYVANGSGEHQAKSYTPIYVVVGKYLQRYLKEQNG